MQRGTAALAPSLARWYGYGRRQRRNTRRAQELGIEDARRVGVRHTVDPDLVARSKVLGALYCVNADFGHV